MNGMENLRRMAVFAAVVEANSFSEAARRLNLTKSAVSRQVTLLEGHLGVRLLNRTTRRLSFTEAGEMFHKSCARIVVEAAEAERVVSQLQNEPRGVLKINAPTTFGNMHLAPALFDFMQKYPGLKVDLALEDGLVNLVQESVDVAIRIGTVGDSRLVAEKLAPIRRLVCGSPAYFKKHGTPKTPEELTDYDWITYSLRESPGRYTFGKNGSQKTVRVHGRLWANNGDIIRSALLADVGIALVPAFMVKEDIEAGRLQTILHDYPVPDMALQAVYSNRNHVSAKIQLFIEFLKTRFSDGSF